MRKLIGIGYMREWGYGKLSSDADGECWKTGGDGRELYKKRKIMYKLDQSGEEMRVQHGSDWESPCVSVTRIGWLMAALDDCSGSPRDGRAGNRSLMHMPSIAPAKNPNHEDRRQYESRDFGA